MTTKPRIYNLPHLVVASVFGGSPAACVLLDKNEQLMPAGRRIPFGHLAFVLLLLEVGLFVFVLAWLGERLNSMWPYVPTMAALLWFAHRRYRDVRSKTIPANPQDAVRIGWVFLALRLALYGLLRYAVLTLSN